MAEKKEDAEILAFAEAQEQFQEEVLNKMNVVGVGVGHKIKNGRDTGDPSITVLVAQKLDATELPSRKDLVETEVSVGSKKFKTDVIEVGDIFAGWQMGGESFDEQVDETVLVKNGVAVAQDVEPLQLTGVSRPAMGGFSVGHPSITAGTIGTAVIDRTPYPGVPTRYYILSNNHVLANSNNARIGDPVLQPGTHDGGRYPQHMIGRLSRFVPIRFRSNASIPSNLVDAAIAEVPFQNVNREIYWLGYTQGTAGARIGSLVQKTGRTTNYTTGIVKVTNLTVDVNYGNGRVARFIRQIATTNMSAGGDSGSLVCDMQDRAVGLLFAGSSQITIASPIPYVEQLLNIRVL